MHRFAPFLFAPLFILALTLPGHAQTEPFTAGDHLPHFSMPAPESSAHRDYLGLTSETSEFTLADVDGPAVLIQIFSMYCPICQREAPEVNALYAALHREGLADAIKILGLGAGNSDLEVHVFQERYDVPFPLISDPDYVLHKAFGGVGTPYFVLVQPSDSAEDGHVVRLSHLGAFDSVEDFLEALLTAKH
ncbi:peroxiredoxin [Desulfonatronum sp. SC1]|uniref:peroxiredoxin family protein n=1 Tax=Desulfonatronum sp. SC1 TaxID=2109626 RepID=UPI000D2FEFE0|nr:TlpA disulfide reductase family protein [Desulfonatronum sp. SC1]PTN38030.1 TlpA family protein disulfide reductase [Desulfonatronum sp. SC1]